MLKLFSVLNTSAPGPGLNYAPDQKGRPFPEGAFGLVRVDEGLALGHFFQLDPAHVRIGKDPGIVYRTERIEIIGPVISGDCEFVPIAQVQAEAAARVL